ncbi:hypothetical protein FXO37_03644 [Capsicum annuum]|nr:hypothetical protein FXO37_03644 [Capsicum annuum]
MMMPGESRGNIDTMMMPSESRGNINVIVMTGESGRGNDVVMIPDKSRRRNDVMMMSGEFGRGNEVMMILDESERGNDVMMIPGESGRGNEVMMIPGESERVLFLRLVLKLWEVIFNQHDPDTPLWLSQGPICNPNWKGVNTVPLGKEITLLTLDALFNFSKIFPNWALGSKQCYRAMSLEIDTWEIEEWRNAEPSRCPFLHDLELWRDAGEFALRHCKKDNSEFEYWRDAP